MTPAAARVLGCLVEKELTTPGQYPLTLLALQAACNQASNREPVVHYGAAEVETALGELKDRGLVRFVLPSHGRSVVRYRHVLDEALGLGPARRALLALLVLRGPQTVGELRARSERRADLGGPDDVARELTGLAAHEDALVARLDRRPGQKEERWAARWAAGEQPVDGAGPAGDPGAGTGPGDLATAVTRLQADLAEIRGAVEDLRSALGELRASLGG